MVRATPRHLASLSALAAGGAALAAILTVGDEPVGVRLLLVLPFVIASGAALARRSIGFAIAIVVLSGWSLMSIASVGLLYLPSCALMAVATLRAHASRAAGRSDDGRASLTR